MDSDTLRHRTGAILAAEEQDPPDWEAVDRLTDALLRQLLAEPDSECPEIVGHYLDDSDIRRRDDGDAARQRAQVQRFVETGEYQDSRPMPLWGCALALALVAAMALVVAMIVRLSL